MRASQVLLVLHHLASFRCTAQKFCKIPCYTLSDIFPLITLELSVSGRRPQRFKCYFYYIISRVRTIKMTHQCGCWPYWHDRKILSGFSVLQCFFSNFPCLHCTLWKRIAMCCLHLQSRQLLEITLHQKFVPSPPCICSTFISLWSYEYLWIRI